MNASDLFVNARGERAVKLQLVDHDGNVLAGEWTVGDIDTFIERLTQNAYHQGRTEGISAGAYEAAKKITSFIEREV